MDEDDGSSHSDDGKSEHEGDSHDRDDFICVPVNNMDKDTVHIKIQSDAEDQKMMRS